MPPVAGLPVASFLISDARPRRSLVSRHHPSQVNKNTHMSVAHRDDGVATSQSRHSERCSEILPGLLYLGSYKAACDPEILAEHNVRGVVSLLKTNKDLAHLSQCY